MLSANRSNRTLNTLRTVCLCVRARVRECMGVCNGVPTSNLYEHIYSHIWGLNKLRQFEIVL